MKNKVSNICTYYQKVLDTSMSGVLFCQNIPLISSNQQRSPKLKWNVLKNNLTNIHSFPHEKCKTKEELLIKCKFFSR